MSIEYFTKTEHIWLNGSGNGNQKLKVSSTRVVNNSLVYYILTLWKSLPIKLRRPDIMKIWACQFRFFGTFYFAWQLIFEPVITTECKEPVSAMFLTHYDNTNWCREFALNFANFEKSNVIFALVGRDFRLALPVTKNSHRRTNSSPAIRRTSCARVAALRAYIFWWRTSQCKHLSSSWLAAMWLAGGAACLWSRPDVHGLIEQLMLASLAAVSYWSLAYWSDRPS